MFFWHADWYLIWDRISIWKCAVYRRKWLEGHVALPLKSQFRGQGIQRRFRCMIWEICITGKHLRTIICIAQFKLATVMLICVHMGQNSIIRMTVTWMIILIAHFALVWKHPEISRAMVNGVPLEPFTLASKNQNLSYIRVFRGKLLGNYP